MSLASLTCLVTETQSSAKGHLLSHTRHSTSAAVPRRGRRGGSTRPGCRGVSGGHCPWGEQSGRDANRARREQQATQPGGQSRPRVLVHRRWCRSRGSLCSSTNPFVLGGSITLR